MKLKAVVSAAVTALLAALFLAACGSSGGGSGLTDETKATTSSGSAAAESTQGGEAPSEAESAATGDIPDNQTFLVFHDSPAGYSIRYPEGWARKGSGTDVTFREKANVIHIVVRNGPPPTEPSAVKGVEQLKKSDPTVKVMSPQKVTLNGEPAVKIEYSRLSPPDPVTGKRLRLVVDRYEYGKGGKVAVLDLETPVGVDNVDAYRLISESFTWR